MSNMYAIRDLSISSFTEKVEELLKIKEGQRLSLSLQSLSLASFKRAHPDSTAVQSLEHISQMELTDLLGGSLESLSVTDTFAIFSINSNNEVRITTVTLKILGV